MIMADPRDFPYMCPTCGPSKRFLTLVGLWSHLENKHPYRPKYSVSVEDLNNENKLESEHPFTAPQKYSSAALELERQLQRARETELHNQILQNAPTQTVIPTHDNMPEPIHDLGVPRPETPNILQQPAAVEKQNHLNSEPRLNREFFRENPVMCHSCPCVNNSMPVAPAQFGTSQWPQSSTSAFNFHPSNTLPKNGYANSSAALLEKFHIKDQLDRLKDYDDLAFTVEKLRESLRVKETKLDRANMELEKLALDRRKLQRETLDLTKENDTHSEYVELLKKHLVEKDKLITEKEKEVVNLTEFLKATAEKEASARAHLEAFINNLIRRAERAETRLAMLQTSKIPPSYKIEPLHIQIDQSSNGKLNSQPYSLDDYIHRREPDFNEIEIEEQMTSPTVNTINFHQPQDQKSYHQPGKNSTTPFSSNDSGLGESAPSSAKTAYEQALPTLKSSHNSASDEQPVNRTEDTLRKQEFNLNERLQDIKTNQSDLLLKPQFKLVYPMEPPVDYSTDSITTVTEDTEPDDPEFRTSSMMRRKSKTNRRKLSKSMSRKMSLMSDNRTPTPSYVRPGHVKRRRDALFCVFMYLDNVTLGRCSMVSREWRDVSRHPALWRNIRLGKARISSKYLITMSKWCTEVHSLTLMGLKARPRKDDETLQQYLQATRASLEDGLECLLKSSSKTMSTLKIVDCRNLLTERSLWLAGCYCRRLQQIVYVSDMYPVGMEVLWSLGAGCPDIKTLIAPPIQPNDRPLAFNDSCCDLLGRCWPNLQIICIGGEGISETGVTAIARNCLRLQILELDHLFEIKEATAAAMCSVGLKGLEVLDFTFTPVTPKALVQFVSACPKLYSISIHIGISDYFKDKKNPQNQAEYKQIVQRLKDLQQRPGFMDILQVETDYG